MNEQRWYIVLAICVLMVFTLGLMHKYGRTLAPRFFGPAVGPVGISEELPDRAPVIDGETETTETEVVSNRKLSPPPDAMFDTPPMAQVAQGFQTLSETAHAMALADEIVNGSASTTLRPEPPPGGSR